jgi:hypothetical protein
MGQQKRVVQVYLLLRHSIDEHVALCAMGKIAEFKRVVDESFGVSRVYSWEGSEFGGGGGSTNSSWSRGTANAYQQMAHQCRQKLAKETPSSRLVAVDTEAQRLQRRQAAEELEQRAPLDLLPFLSESSSPRGNNLVWAGDPGLLRAVHLLRATEMLEAGVVPAGTLFFAWSVHETSVPPAESRNWSVGQLKPTSTQFGRIALESLQKLARSANQCFLPEQQYPFAVFVHQQAQETSRKRLRTELESQGVAPAMIGRPQEKETDDYRMNAELQARIQAYVSGERTRFEYAAAGTALTVRLYVTTKGQSLHGCPPSTLLPTLLLCHLQIPSDDLLPWCVPTLLESSTCFGFDCDAAEFSSQAQRVLKSLLQGKGPECLFRSICMLQSPAALELWTTERPGGQQRHALFPLAPEHANQLPAHAAAELARWQAAEKTWEGNTPPYTNVLVYRENSSLLFRLFATRFLEYRWWVEASAITGWHMLCCQPA